MSTQLSSEPVNEAASIQVNPNPATDYLQIQLPDENEASFVKLLNRRANRVGATTAIAGNPHRHV
jgi:hypothetical protein